MNEETKEDALADRLEFACNLARQVGREALRFWDERGTSGLGIQAKGPQDFVTLADRQAEQTIRSELARVFPADGFIGKETGGEAGQGGYWVILTPKPGPGCCDYAAI